MNFSFRKRTKTDSNKREVHPHGQDARTGKIYSEFQFSEVHSRQQDGGFPKNRTVKI